MQSGGALFTDLYELTMIAGYHHAGITAPATFELYVRELPPNRSFLVAAGLEQALAFLEGLHFTAADIDHLRRLPNLAHVPAAFFDDYLPRFRFTGEVWAIEEGTPVFPPEPLMRITAPIAEAQIVETALLALVGFQTSVASRTARVIEAAAGRPVIDFGARRAHGLEAGLLAARATFLAGCEATSNVAAGRQFGIPVSGTMAHSWVMAFPDEMTAFRAYMDCFGDESVLLIDTYDTERAAQAIVASGMKPRAVRLDSGDLIAVSRSVRAILDGGGLRDTAIFVSSDLHEERIADIVAADAPIDGFGVGGALSTASDAPALGAIYKLVEIERHGAHAPIMKLSPGKHSYPGRKQVWRRFDNERTVADTIDLADASASALRASVGQAHELDQPLLTRVMANGRRERPATALAELRTECRLKMAMLPASVRRLRDAATYPVHLGAALRETIDRLTHGRAASSVR